MVLEKWVPILADIARLRSLVFQKALAARTTRREERLSRARSSPFRDFRFPELCRPSIHFVHPENGVTITLLMKHEEQV